MSQLPDPDLLAVVQPRKRRKKEIYYGPYFGPSLPRDTSNRASKRGQPVFTNAPAAAHSTDTTDLVDLLNVDVPSSHKEAAESGAPSEWANRQARANENWETLVQSSSHEMVDKACLAASLHLTAQQQTQLHIQQLLDEAWRGHQCSAGVNCRTADSMQAAGISFVAEHADCEYISFSHRFNVRLQYWSCKHCSNHCFTAHPIHVGCWFSSPCKPSFLFDLAIMVFYQNIQQSGLSMTGMYSNIAHYLDLIAAAGACTALTCTMLTCTMQTFLRACTALTTVTLCTPLTTRSPSAQSSSAPLFTTTLQHTTGPPQLLACSAVKGKQTQLMQPQITLPTARSVLSRVGVADGAKPWLVDCHIHWCCY